MSDYFGRLLGRTFEKPAITPRVRARFEPMSEDHPDVDVERAPIEREEARAEPGVAVASPAEDSVPEAVALEPEVRELQPQPAREVIKEKMRVVRERVVRERSAPPPLSERPLPIEEGDEPALALPTPMIAPRTRKRTPASSPPRLDQPRSPAPALGPSRAFAQQVNDPQIIERSTIKVTIGHLELRAPSAEEKKGEKPKEQQTMMLTLDDYVRDRKEGRR